MVDTCYGEEYLFDVWHLLSAFVRRRRPARPVSRPPTRVSPVKVNRPPRVPATSSSDSTLGPLTAEQTEFLDGLIAEDAPPPLVQGSRDDGLFLDGMHKRWQARRLELPVLPTAAIRLTDILRAGDTPLAPLVELIESDAALSVEVLKAANAAIFANVPSVRSIHDAILRIGLRRLGSVLLMTQLTTKVLKGGAVQHKGALLMEMASPLGYVAGQLAKAGETEDLALIRGTLLHVEHMVILGAVADVSRDHKQPIKPSVSALLRAIRDFGPAIRKAVATAWNLQDMLILRPEVAEEYAGFRRAIVSRWLGRELPSLGDVEPDRLEAVMSQIRPRQPIADSRELKA